MVRQGKGEVAPQFNAGSSTVPKSLLSDSAKKNWVQQLQLQDLVNYNAQMPGPSAPSGGNQSGSLGLPKT